MILSKTTIVFVFSSLFLLYSIPINHQSKIELSEKLNRNFIDINLNIGRGLYHFNIPEYQYNIPFNWYGVYAGFKYKNSFLYQGIEFGLLNLEKSEYKYFVNAKSTNISAVGNHIIQASYLISTRHYGLSDSKVTGLTYRKVYFGFGPSYFKYDLHEDHKFRTTYYKCHRAGIQALTGISFSFLKSSVTIGIELRVADIFAPPRPNENFYNAYFWAPVSLHQQVAAAAFTLNFDF